MKNMGNDELERENKSNSIIFGLGLLIAITCAIIGITLSASSNNAKNSPEVGDIWKHYATGDPFIEEDIYTWEVIDIKRGFVKYIENDIDTLSESILVFKFNSEKIYNKLNKKNSN